MERIAMTHTRETDEDLLSFNQEHKLFLESLSPQRPVSQLWWTFEAFGALDVDALEQAMREVVERHTALRTIFPSSGPRRRTLRADERLFEMQREDASTLVADDGGALVHERVRQMARRPFDLEKGPLVRLCVLRMHETRYFVLLVIHHIAVDGWSMAILWSELAQIYRSRVTALPLTLPSTVPYEKFARWQRQHFNGEVLEEHTRYWKQQLTGSVSLALPTDFPRPRVRQCEGRTFFLAIDAEEVSELRGFCRKHQCTLFTLLLTAVNAAVHVWTGATDVRVASPIANRSSAEFENTIGYFMNAIVLRTRVHPGTKWHELLDSVGNTVLDGLHYGGFPFTRLLPDLAYETAPGFPAVAQIVFGLQSQPTTPIRLDGLTIVPNWIDIGVARADLTVVAFPREDRLELLFEYDMNLFERRSIEIFAGHFFEALRAIASKPDESVDGYASARRIGSHSRDNAARQHVAATWTERA
jgi:hypothetical protein